MKTHEIAVQLELLAKILRSMPNLEFDESEFKSLFESTKNKTDAKKSNIKKSTIPVDIEIQLKNMSPVEIEKYLLSNEKPFTVSQLQEITDRLGITSSKRQNKEALINLITKFFEASQMDSIIRSSKGTES